MHNSKKKKSKFQKSALFLVKFGFSLFCIFHLIDNFGDEFSTISYSPEKFNFLHLFIALSLFFASQLVSVWRWQICCESLGLIPAKQSAATGSWLNKELLRIYFIGLFWNNFLPSALGGDLIRAYILKKNNTSFNWSECAGSVFVDRAFGLVMLSSIGFIAALFLKNQWQSQSLDTFPQNILLGLGLITFFSVLGMIMIVFLSRIFAKNQESQRRKEALKNLISSHSSKTTLRILSKLNSSGKSVTANNNLISKISAKFSEFACVPQKICGDKRVLLKLCLSSIAIQVLVTYCLIFSASALGLQIGEAFLWIVNPIVTLGILIAPSINGLGVREGIYAYLFKSFGYSGANGILLSIAWLLIISLVSLPGAVFMVFKRENLNEEILEINDNAAATEPEKNQISNDGSASLEAMRGRD